MDSLTAENKVNQKIKCEHSKLELNYNWSQMNNKNTKRYLRTENNEVYYLLTKYIFN